MPTKKKMRVQFHTMCNIECVMSATPFPCSFTYMNEV